MLSLRRKKQKFWPKEGTKKKVYHKEETHDSKDPFEHDYKTSESKKNENTVEHKAP